MLYILIVVLIVIGIFWLVRRVAVTGKGDLKTSQEETSSAPHEKPRILAPPRTPSSASHQKQTAQPTPVASAGDIFISYASADRPTAQTLAKALQDEGWSVWWDRTIPPGKSFDEVIETALNAAKCVVVLWSRTSVASDWVKTEAAEAARRHILIPALITEVTIPLEFRRLQAADLIGWPASQAKGGFQSLVDSIADMLGNPKAPGTKTPVS